MYSLTEMELTILDRLADGPLPLPLLASTFTPDHDLRLISLFVTTLLGLLDRDFVQCGSVPGGPSGLTPPRERMIAQIHHAVTESELPFWVELTEVGQMAWEAGGQGPF